MNFILLYSLVSMLMVLPFDLYAQKAEGASPSSNDQQTIEVTVQTPGQADTSFVFYKDPFESYLPKEAESGKTIQAKEGDLGPPPVTIEGILWGSSKPMAIIDGEVYSVGDTLVGVGAKVFKIKDNIVFISYGERIYEMTVTKNVKPEVETKGVQ